jgi:hypothetical protein
MIRDNSRQELWTGLDFAGPLSSAAFGSSFESLANFLIGGISGPSERSGADDRRDARSTSRSAG